MTSIYDDVYLRAFASRILLSESARMILNGLFFGIEFSLSSGRILSYHA